MYKQIAWLLILSATPALAAQEKGAKGIAASGTNLEQALQQLKAAREELETERQAVEKLRPSNPALLSEENSRLRVRVTELLSKLGTRKEKTPVADKNSLPVAAVKPPPKQGAIAKGSENGKDGEPAGVQPLNPLALAHSLFQTGNYEAALKAYRMIDLKGMKAEERLPIQYMVATCLKHMNKLEEATALYREIANSRGDEQVAGCAQWQLSALRWHRELNNELADVRQRRHALEKTP